MTGSRGWLLSAMNCGIEETHSQPAGFSTSACPRRIGHAGRRGSSLVSARALAKLGYDGGKEAVATLRGQAPRSPRSASVDDVERPFSGCTWRAPARSTF